MGLGGACPSWDAQDEWGMTCCLQAAQKREKVMKKREKGKKRKAGKAGKTADEGEEDGDDDDADAAEEQEEAPKKKVGKKSAPAKRKLAAKEDKPRKVNCWGDSRLSGWMGGGGEERRLLLT